MIFENDGETPNPSEADELVLWARTQLSAWDANAGDWTEEAIKSYSIIAADQWSDADRAQMEEDDRPMFTFNRVAGFVRGICGLEVSNRQEVRYLGRDTSDSAVVEVLNAAAKWVRDHCDAEDEESDAFKDMVTCGLGWTETHFSEEHDPEGQIFIERIDPLHMRFDPGARKRGLVDTRWRARLKWLPLEEVRNRWGKKKADEVAQHIETDAEALVELFSTPHDATKALEYEKTASGQRVKRGVPVVQFQYFKLKTYVRISTPEGETDVPEDRYKKLQELMPDLPGTRFRKREFRQLVFSGVTKFEDLPLPTDDFTFQAITGIRDRNKGIWYGFVRDLLDPQLWVNKFFSSMADVVASQAKGGLLAEADAFVNKDQAQDDWANPRSIVWLKRGGLDKIRERANAGIPSGVAQLLEFTVASLPHVAGVNLEFLGLANREQPGVLEAQRKQAAIATLAEFFNAMRLYRKQQGRVLLQFIETYLSDGRLIRIVGNEGEQFVPLVRMPGMRKFDVVVDEAPTAPDIKARTWAAVSQIIPVAAKMGLPIPPEVLDYAPFPQSLAQAWKRQLSPAQQLPPQVQQQMQQMQQQLQQLAQENQKLKSKQEETMLSLQIEQQRAQAEIQIDQMKQQANQQKAEADVAAKLQAMQADISVRTETARQELALKAEIAQRELELKEAIAARELALKTAVESASLQQAQAQVDMKARFEEILELSRQLFAAQQEHRTIIEAVAQQVNEIDSGDKQVELEFSPDGDVVGAKVRRRKARK